MRSFAPVCVDGNPMSYGVMNRPCPLDALAQQSSSIAECESRELAPCNAGVTAHLHAEVSSRALRGVFY
jgi:hypothetical protein